MLREIRLYGELGRRFGRVHYLAVKSIGEAIRALMANFQDFENAMINGATGYRVWSGPTRIGQVEDINLPSGQRDVIRIAPIVVGAKSPFGAILLGAALIAVAVFVPGLLPSVTLWGGTTVASLVGSIGFGLVLGGVAGLLSKQPTQAAGSQDKSAPSYIFNGAVNTTAQGGPVPVGYGRLIVGSAVISSSISTVDIPV